MKVVIQRVSSASVSVNQEIIGQIQKGILLLVGFESEESAEEMDWMIRKITNLRIFNDENGVMNLSLQDVEGELLVVSQFTLHAQTKKGNRPSYIKSAKPDVAKVYYNDFVNKCKTLFQGLVQTGEFGADMKVSLLNDGPVTIIIDSKNKE